MCINSCAVWQSSAEDVSYISTFDDARHPDCWQPWLPTPFTETTPRPLMTEGADVYIHHLHTR
jgi:hypothetical protein